MSLEGQERRVPVARTQGRSPMAAGASEKRCIQHRALSAACGGFRMPQLIEEDTGAPRMYFWAPRGSPEPLRPLVLR